MQNENVHVCSVVIIPDKYRQEIVIEIFGAVTDNRYEFITAGVM